TFPYGKDPLDRNLRIAPSYPTVGELRTASEILCLCAKLATIEKML
ncbi:MAG: aminotransferase, partial [Clostridia bacterium]|nr:aminotransferase [Clostridia bacterium]